MAKRAGARFSVKLGTDLVVGIFSVAINGIKVDQMDTTAFGDTWKQYMSGMKDGGDLSFDGFFDPDDDSGQELLRLANLNDTQLTNLRIMIDNTSYYEPCQTDGYYSPALTSGQQTQKSYLNVVSYDIKAGVSDVAKSTFNCKVSGCMVLV